MKRLLILIALLASACATPPATVSRSAGDRIFEASFEDLPEHGITKFDIRLSADVPPWRAWNLVITDPQRLAELTNGEAEVRRFAFIKPTEVALQAEIHLAWYLPTIHVDATWLIHPDELGWEQQCTGAGTIVDCYIRGGFSPLDGGARTLVHYQGYLRRPWFSSYARTVESLIATFEAAQPALSLVALNPKYGNRDTKFPWDEMNAFAAAGPGMAAPASIERGAKPRLLVQDFVVNSASATDATVVRLASTYMAERLASSGKFSVLTDWDVRLMAKYLNAEWSLRCHDDPACTEKLLSLTRARYVLAGEVARTGDAYTLSFVVLDAESLTPAWRFTRETPAASEDLRAAIAEAAAAASQTL